MKILSKILAGLLILLILTYATGVASQVSYAVVTWFNDDGFGTMVSNFFSFDEVEEVIEESPPLRIGHPLYALRALTNTPYVFYGAGVVALLLGAILVMVTRNSAVDGEVDKERNFIYSNKGSYGTAGWMTEAEMKKELEITSDLKNCTGIILGELNGKAVCVPENTRMNKNVAVYGASGTMKSRAYVRNKIFQCVKRGTSLVITDPKGEMYASMAEYLRMCKSCEGYPCVCGKRDNMYIVKVFNLVSPENSDSWNCLREIEGSELYAQMFADVIIKNTGSGKGDHFWDNSEMCLLKALCLYVEYGDTYADEDKNIGEMYKLLTMASGSQLYTMFDNLKPDHPAKAPFAIFQQASDNVRGGIIIGLASRIQVFQNQMICEITKHKDIDITLPGKTQCAYFCITSDQDSTFDFLSSLFLSFLFIKLVRFADSQNGQRLPVPVHLLADELANIGEIPDLTKKISTVRSREISMSVIFQNLAQMENRYPDNQWLEIIGNCDTQLFLGCTDPVTAEYISNRTGEITIGVDSLRKDVATIRMTNYVPRHQETVSVGQRKLLTPDEILRMPSHKALLILRSQKVLEVNKMDFTKHPEARKLRECNQKDHIPNWRRERDGELEPGEIPMDEPAPERVVTPPRPSEAHSKPKPIKATTRRKDPPLPVEDSIPLVEEIEPEVEVLQPTTEPDEKPELPKPTPKPVEEVTPEAVKTNERKSPPPKPQKPPEKPKSPSPPSPPPTTKREERKQNVGGNALDMNPESASLNEPGNAGFGSDCDIASVGLGDILNDM